MSKMQKWAAGTFVACYMTVLAAGIVGHTLKVGLVRNTLSYFVVWDMFCGWAAYDVRTHVIAESSDGRYFDVREPWGEFRPFGSLGRLQYDFSTQLAPKFIPHVLERTDHPPIDCVYLVEEAWPKQFNLPESLWESHFGGEPDKTTYFHLRAVCGADGRYLNVFPEWLQQQKLNSIADNPRLQREVSQARSSFGMLYVPTMHSAGHRREYVLQNQPATN